MIMTKHVLKVSFDGEEGAILRLLGLIQRRGFSVEGIDMPQTDDTRKTVMLTVKPVGLAYRVDVLQRQIERLHEVREVSVIAPKPPRRVPEFLRKPVARIQQSFHLQDHNL